MEILTAIIIILSAFLISTEITSRMNIKNIENIKNIKNLNYSNYSTDQHVPMWMILTQMYVRSDSTLCDNSNNSNNSNIPNLTCSYNENNDETCTSFFSLFNGIDGIDGIDGKKCVNVINTHTSHSFYVGQSVYKHFYDLYQTTTCVNNNYKILPFLSTKMCYEINFTMYDTQIWK